MFLKFDFRGETSYKIHPNFDFWFFILREKFSKCHRAKKVNFDVVIAPQGCLEWKRCIIQKVNESWLPTIFVKAWPPISQLLFSEPGIGPFIGRFWRAGRASGLRQIKKLHKTKCKSFMVPFNYCLMHYPQISNFYQANLKTHPLLRMLMGL